MDTQFIARHIFKTMVECLEASENSTVEQVCEAASRAQAMMYAMIGRVVFDEPPAHTYEAPVVVDQEKPKRKRRSKAEIEADKAIEYYDASNREHKKIFADAFTSVGYSIDTQAELAKELSKAAEKAKRLPVVDNLVEFLKSEEKGE